MQSNYINMSPSEYACKFIGTKYTWGGKSADEGFDCSGLVSEGLKGVGILGNKALLNSQDLYNHFIQLQNSPNFKVASLIAKDSLLFFGESTKEIGHVALAINKYFLVESAGEGRQNTKKGFVRLRPIKYRSDLVAALNVSFL